MPRYAIKVAYDGTNFRGFAPNLGVRTVAGELRDALGTIFGRPPTLTCAGRTDAGVHAIDQTVTFETDQAHPNLGRLRLSLNGLCGPEIAVRQVVVAPPDFDARFSCVGRTYRYTVLTGPVPDPLLRFTTWHVPQALSVERMHAAVQPLVGVHDFSSFCRRKLVTGLDGEEHEAPRTRNLRAVAWRRIDERRVAMDIEASSFCQQMVRSITGLSVDIGRGRVGVNVVSQVLAARNRGAVPRVAPPTGLCLVATSYGDADVFG